MATLMVPKSCGALTIVAIVILASSQSRSCQESQKGLPFGFRDLRLCRQAGELGSHLAVLRYQRVIMIARERRSQIDCFVDLPKVVRQSRIDRAFQFLFHGL